MGQGNRGMAFEKLINLSNEMYQRGRVALIKQASDSCKGIKDGLWPCERWLLRI
ncbi:hypothetical protein IKK_05406 [Bacillus mycoides]|nr:hypothetical protein IKM_05185 [Bacillus mycoides]EOO34601.1 hypothetical protein IKK_05406 [Bacillus mycoides]OSY02536.1 hypothetical protein S2E19_03916 [Bacillus mycoides]SFQ92502.1 recombination protein U [Bacillus mycoides]